MGIIDKIVDKMTDEAGIFRGGEEGRPLGRARDIIFGESKARAEELETGSTPVPPLTPEEELIAGSTPVPPEDLLPASRYADPSMDPGTIRDEDVFDILPGEADLFADPTLMRNEPGRVAAREEADWEGTGMSQDEFAENLLLTIAGGGAAGYGLKKLLQYGGREGAKAVQRAVARRNTGQADDIRKKFAAYLKDWRRQHQVPSMKPTTGPARTLGKMPPGAYRPPVEANKYGIMKGGEVLASPIDKYLKMLPPEKANALRKVLESPALIGMTKKSARY